ncbi:MAG: glycoside hydrolase family 2 TIM barrel-domain containing protein [Thermoguttaceae bacterium]|jgi:hypothetical protein
MKSIGFWVSLLTLALLPALSSASTNALPPRRVVSLDGAWQVGQGSMTSVPASFSHTVVVPGLIDMAAPAFAEVGHASKLREAFWLRRTFHIDGPVPAVALLKINKARYGTKVFLNGKLVGEHVGCFTPGYFDVKGQLQGAGRENQLIVRVGAGREALPADTPTGWDFEKWLYIPGIYDSVELILSGRPYISNVQVVPDPARKTVGAEVEIDAGGKPGPVTLRATVAEAKSGEAVGFAEGSGLATGGGPVKGSLRIPIRNCRPWSPEDPFLYELRVGTGGDAASARFGMRSFRFDPQAKRGVLNDKVYFMRGSNVCAYRFFEDAARGDLPWRADWVRRLHRKFRRMNWNALRYCIGFPPECWYDIADEEGFLIQDEFPIWLLDKAPENPLAAKIIPQYTEWMRERWNHPCVVIWDGQNESFTNETGKAICAVRGLDKSNRPWENGWSEPQSPTDCRESHPYRFIKGWGGKQFFHLSELEGTAGKPDLNDRQRKLDVPVIINEYDWLWITRDGQPTSLDEHVYRDLLGAKATPAQRRLLYARTMAALTEYWRCHREAAAVMEFCGLSYSRSGAKPRPEGGATSDHFLDVAKLEMEPAYAEYVGEAFNPVGLMLDFWREKLAPGERREVKVYVINDRETPWQGQVELSVAGPARLAETKTLTVPGLGRQIITFALIAPDEPGGYQLTARLSDGGKSIRSIRDFQVSTAK